MRASQAPDRGISKAHSKDGTRYQGQIGETDRDIDRLIYDLYVLTEEEIEIVEGAAQ